MRIRIAQHLCAGIGKQLSVDKCFYLRRRNGKAQAKFFLADFIRKISEMR